MIWNTRKDNSVWAVNAVPQTLINVWNVGTLFRYDEDSFDQYAEYNAGGWTLFPVFRPGPRTVYDLKYNEIK